MSGVSPEMNLRRMGRCSLVGLGLGVPWLAAGCAATGAPRAALPPALVRRGDDGFEVHAYGDLPALFDAPAPTSRLAAFLYGPEQPAPSLFGTPQGLAARDGKLYVSDQGAPDVLRMDLSSGAVARWTHTHDRPACPVAVAMAGDRLYVADTTRNQVLGYDPLGRLVGRLVPPGRTAASFHPTGVAVHGSTLYIADSGMHAVHRWEIDSTRWAVIQPPPAWETPLSSPTGLAVTRDGTLLICDAVMGVVHRVAPSGTWLAPIGRRGRRPGEFVRPIGVCSTGAGFIVVADAAKQVVSFFRPDGEFIVEVDSPGGEGATWVMPGGVAWLDGFAPDHLFERIEIPSGRSTEWLAVSDTLGNPGLALLALTHHENHDE